MELLLHLAKLAQWINLIRVIPVYLWKPNLVIIVPAGGPGPKGAGLSYQQVHWWIEYQDIILVLVEYKRKTLRPRQNGCHFPDDILKWTFVNENIWILINISLKFVLMGPINNIPAMVQIRLGADQATSHYLNQWRLIYQRSNAYMRHSASMS